MLYLLRSVKYLQTIYTVYLLRYTEHRVSKPQPKAPLLEVHRVPRFRPG
jgi:hypothetical protein